MLKRDDNRMYQLNNVCKRYRLHGQYFSGNTTEVTALENISCNIKKNTIFGIVGESGSGKSTLIRMLVGAEKPTSGSIIYQDDIFINELRASALSKYQSHVKMIFQDPARSLNHRLTVGEILKESLWHSPNFKNECITLGLEKKQSRKLEMEHRILQMLTVVGFDESILSRYPTEFSGGQRQRIAIVRALIHKPEVLICDEIIASLDASTRRSIIDMLIMFKKKYNITIIFIAHDLSLVLYLCDEIMVLSDGKLQEVARAEKIFCTPSSRATKILIDAIPTFPAKKTRSSLS